MSVIVRYGTDFPVCWDGVVDAPEQCDDRNRLDGDCCSATCQLESVGSACAADGDPCTVDVCDGAGACTHGPADDGTPCDDGDVCTIDACQSGLCMGTAEPDPSCHEPVPPSRGLLVVDGDRKRFFWNWFRGEATAGFPEQDYTLCLYDTSAGTQPVARLETGGNLCGQGQYYCWKPRGSQPIYVDGAGTHDGITRIYFRPGADAETRIALRARGPNFSTPPLPLVPPVTVQLHGVPSGECWSASYSTPRRNDAELFRAAPD